MEDQQGDLPSVEDAALWRDTLELGFTVLADTEQTWADVWARNGDRHTYTVVDTDGVVTLHLYGSTSGTLDTLIEAATAP